MTNHVNTAGPGLLRAFGTLLMLTGSVFLGGTDALYDRAKPKAIRRARMDEKRARMVGGQKRKIRNSRENIVEDAVLNRILELMKMKGMTEKEMVGHLGLANGAFTPWKYEGSKTYLQHIGPMSEYLGVTPNYLLYGVDEYVNMDTISATEIDLIRLYRKMNERKKDCLIRTARVFADEE